MLRFFKERKRLMKSLGLGYLTLYPQNEKEYKYAVGKKPMRNRNESAED